MIFQIDVIVNLPSGSGCSVTEHMATKDALEGGRHGQSVSVSGCSSNTTDDRYRPVAVGSYDLKWDGDEGVHTVSGSNVDPVWPSLHEVSCRIPGRG
jgi:hypothetical protein